MKAPTIGEMEKEIAKVCDEVCAMLLQKNAAYGNSVPDPLCVFSKANAMERIHVRLDDKLSRIARGTASGEDTEMDLIGYLVLKRAILKLENKQGEQR